jgi:hypothetical protein
VEFRSTSVVRLDQSPLHICLPELKTHLSSLGSGRRQSFPGKSQLLIGN